MNKNEISPYIRLAMFSTLTAPFKINRRIIFDYELILVTGGKCKITIENTEYICKKNDVIFLRPGIPHKFEDIEGYNFVQPHIHFDVFYSDKSEKRFVSFKPKEEMTADELDLVQEDIFCKSIPDVFTLTDMNKFKNYFFAVIELFLQKADNYELLCKSNMLQLLNCLMMQFNSETASTSNFSSDPVISVKNYIDNNYLSVITLDSLSKQFYINKYTLLRKFKAMYNQNIISYYRSKRIGYIKNMLKSTTISITDLSESLNFSDIYSFSRFFKTYVGTSPSVYRKNQYSDKKSGFAARPRRARS